MISGRGHEIERDLIACFRQLTHQSCLDDDGKKPVEMERLKSPVTKQEEEQVKGS